MQFAMVGPAKGYSEFVADLQRQPARLCEPDVMRIRRRSAADDTRLGSDKGAMASVASADGLNKDRLLVIDLLRSWLDCLF